MTDTEKLEKIISESGLKLQFLANGLGISRYSLNKKIHNVTQFKSEEISRLCNMLKIKDLKEKDLIFFAKRVD